jgi:hypothetical protein
MMGFRYFFCWNDNVAERRRRRGQVESGEQLHLKRERERRRGEKRREEKRGEERRGERRTKGREE